MDLGLLSLFARRFFVALLSCPDEEVREQAVWALGNIAGDNVDFRDHCLACGVMQPLLALVVPQAKVPLLRNATWTISNLCRGRPQPSFELILPALSSLRMLLQIDDDEILIDACWALSYLSEESDPSHTRIQAICTAGIVPRMTALLAHRNHKIKTPALRCIGNIVNGNDSHTQVCSLLLWLFFGGKLLVLSVHTSLIRIPVDGALMQRITSTRCLDPAFEQVDP